MYRQIDIYKMLVLQLKMINDYNITILQYINTLSLKISSKVMQINKNWKVQNGSQNQAPTSFSIFRCM